MLLRRHKFNAALTMLVVAPVNDLGVPLACVPFGGKWLAVLIRPVFLRP